MRIKKERREKRKQRYTKIREKTERRGKGK